MINTFVHRCLFVRADCVNRKWHFLLEKVCICMGTFECTFFVLEFTFMTPLGFLWSNCACQGSNTPTWTAEYNSHELVDSSDVFVCRATDLYGSSKTKKSGIDNPNNKVFVTCINTCVMHSGLNPLHYDNCLSDKLVKF